VQAVAERSRCKRHLGCPEQALVARLLLAPQVVSKASCRPPQARLRAICSRGHPPLRSWCSGWAFHVCESCICRASAGCTSDVDVAGNGLKQAWRTTCMAGGRTAAAALFSTAQDNLEWQESDLFTRHPPLHARPPRLTHAAVQEGAPGPHCFAADDTAAVPQTPSRQHSRQLL